jgi:uncharacterized protein YcbK (DUF882 family)
MPNQLTRDFSDAEFACRHCGQLGVQLRLVEALQGLRDKLNVPVTITSGYRCAQHPVEAMKAAPGWHTQGLAADVAGPAPLTIWQALVDFPEFAGVGVAIHQGYVHLDIRPGVPSGGRVVWAYDRSGKDVKWSGRWAELPK